ncbi:MAG: DNA repair protein RadA [Rhizobiales bacterium]|nr:DNA repair protein RadA [Hyphomicrobiales bacterium]
MAAKAKSQFVCQNCGAVSSRWQGRCEDCGEWNTLVEESATGGVGAGPGGVLRKGRVVALTSLVGGSAEAPRVVTGIAEFDRVTGGGFVRGSALLVGGDPGIGKSTLLLQAAAALANRGVPVVYVSGEEAAAQIQMRAERLGLSQAPVRLASETSVEDILATLGDGKPPGLVVIDSIQTLWTERADSAPGTVTQVRAASQALIRYAKQSGACVVFVDHVTKDGQIAGPRVVEHMVDAVLYFEGDGGHHYRILRGVKNRFGPTDEIGVFEMTGAGLREVANPSELFLGERNAATPGAAVFAGMEGTRPILVEIQAMILAVLETHCRVRLGDCEVYLNVAGGLRIDEPAADLAVAAALVSSRLGTPLPPDRVYFGEVSLSGAIRPVSHAGARLKEARKLGFGQAVMPASALERDSLNGATGVEQLADLVASIAAASRLREAAE